MERAACPNNLSNTPPQRASGAKPTDEQARQQQDKSTVRVWWNMFFGAQTTTGRHLSAQIGWWRQGQDWVEQLAIYKHFASLVNWPPSPWSRFEYRAGQGG